MNMEQTAGVSLVMAVSHASKQLNVRGPFKRIPVRDELALRIYTLHGAIVEAGTDGWEFSEAFDIDEYDVAMDALMHRESVVWDEDMRRYFASQEVLEEAVDMGVAEEIMRLRMPPVDSEALAQP